MPKLLKEILPEDTYVTNSDKGRVRKQFTKQNLEELATTANKMIAAGLKIPVPFDHSKAALPVEFNKSPASAYNNAGYWLSFNVRENSEGKPTLVGVADIPGASDQPDTPFYKALNSSKDVSLSIRDEYVDGLGRVWKNAILHGALVNHAVVPNQKDFEQIPEGSLVYNMSMLDSAEQNDNDVVDPGLLDQVRSALQEACEIVLPSSSKASVFLRDLLVAASQIKASRPSSGQELQPVPIYMSIGDNPMSMTQAQAESLVATKATNPVTGKPWTMEDLGFKVAPQQTTDMSALQAKLDEKDAQLAKASALIQALVARTVQDVKSSIQARVNKLIANGIVSKEYADAHFAPKLDYQMSTLQDGTMAPHPLEVTLSALEQLPAINKQQPNQPTFDGFIQPPPFQAGPEMSAEEMNKAIEEFITFVP